MNNQTLTSQWNDETKKETADTFVVLLHGMDCSPETLAALVDRVKADMPTASIYVPKLPFAWYRSLDLKELSEEVSAQINEKLNERSISTFVLIGHSAGGVLAQSVYLTIQEKEAYKDLRENLASSCVNFRLVLIAPLTRGWAINHHLPVVQKISWILGLCFIPFLWFCQWLKHPFDQKNRKEPWIMQLRRGSPFLVWLRLAWLEG